METKSKLTTLCYIEKDEKYLMLHRVLKKNDINKDKWIGVGGHFEKGESPEDCLLREVKEENRFDFNLLPISRAYYLYVFFSGKRNRYGVHVPLYSEWI